MTEMAPGGSQFDAKDYDSKMQELLGDDDLFTSYDEVCESFDDMGIQETLPRGNNMDTGATVAAPARRKGKKKRKRKRKARKLRTTPDDRAAQSHDRQQHE